MQLYLTRKTILVLTIVLCLCMSKAGATTMYDDGGVHEINSHISQGVGVINSPTGDATTVNLVSGGLIYWLSSIEDSRVNILGGAIFQSLVSGGWLSAKDNSIITFSDGWMWSDLNAFNTSQVIFSGGEIGGNLVANDESEIIMSGGGIGVNLLALENSYVTVSGGVIYGDLRAGNNSQVAIYGGIIGVDLEAWGSSQVTIYGTGFNYAYGPLLGTGTLTGTLANGDTINNLFEIHDDASIILAPEPSTLLLLGAGAVMLRKRG